MGSIRFRIMVDGLESLRMGGEGLSTMQKALSICDIYAQEADYVLQWRTAGKRWKDVQEGELEGAIAFREARA